MKRWLIIPLVVLGLAVLAGAGYLRVQSTQAKAAPPVQAPSTVAVSRGDVQETVTAPGRLVGTHERMLSAEATGKLAEVLVRPGQAVRAGEVLARLDPAPLTVKVATAQSDLDLARARLDKVKAGPTAGDRLSAQADLASAQVRLKELTGGAKAADLIAARADLDAAQAQLDKLKAGPDQTTVQSARDALEIAKNSLWSTQLSRDAACGGPDPVACKQGEAGVGNSEVAVRQAQATLDRALAGPAADAIREAEQNVAKARARLAQLGVKPAAEELQAAQLQVQKAQDRLTELDAGPNPIDLKQAEATVRAAQLALDDAQAALGATTVTAPFAGVVLEVKASAGETVANGASLIRLADTTALEVEASIVEEDFPLVKVGQPVEIFFDAQPDADVKGRVARIVPQRSTGDRPVFPLYIALEGSTAGLAPGMTVDAAVVLAARTNVLRLPRTVIRSNNGNTAALEVWTGTRVEKRTVQVGVRGDRYVEIISGLAEGDRVVTP